jgi:hypothetical protein
MQKKMTCQVSITKLAKQLLMTGGPSRPVSVITLAALFSYSGLTLNKVTLLQVPRQIQMLVLTWLAVDL